MARSKPVLVPVISAEGGVGRSTLTLAVGGVTARNCRQSVLAVDAAHRPWSGLRPRSIFRSHATSWDVYQAPHMLASKPAARLATQTDPSGLNILVAEEDLTPPRRPITLPELGRALGYAYRSFEALLIDLPPFAPSMAGAIANATGVLVVCRAKDESLAHVQRLLSVIWPMGGRALMTTRCVVAVNSTSPRVEREVAAREAMLASSGVAVMRMPYDPGLAGGPIDVMRLKRRSRAVLENISRILLPTLPLTQQIGNRRAG
jgi:MinD-like ATPase involved in chromosome partitioning or flagellar assembly